MRLTQSALVIAGTNGEAVTLTSEETSRLIKSTRDNSQRLDRTDLPITLGCGGGCTRDLIAETKIAREAGADFALVLVPSYFHFAMNEDANCGFLGRGENNKNQELSPKRFHVGIGHTLI